MATYTELYTLKSNADLQQRTVIAVMEWAEDKLSTGTPIEIMAASQILRNPDSWGKAIFHAVLMDMKDQTVATIEAATDTQILTSVTNAMAEWDLSQL